MSEQQDNPYRRALAVIKEIRDAQAAGDQQRMDDAYQRLGSILEEVKRAEQEGESDFEQMLDYLFSRKGCTGH